MHTIVVLCHANVSLQSQRLSLHLVIDLRIICSATWMSNFFQKLLIASIVNCLLFAPTRCLNKQNDLILEIEAIPISMNFQTMDFQAIVLVGWICCMSHYFPYVMWIELVFISIKSRSERNFPSWRREGATHSARAPLKEWKTTTT